MVFSKKRPKSLDVFRHSVEKPHKTWTTQLISSIVLKKSCYIGISKQNSKKKIDVGRHVSVLRDERKNPYINHMGKQNGGSQTVLTAPLFCLFIFWYTVKRNGVDRNRVEQPVWPVFPDYHSVSCDYNSTKKCKYFFKVLQWGPSILQNTS